MPRIRPLLVLAALAASMPATVRADDEVPQRSAPEPGDPEARRKAMNEEQAARARGDMEGYLQRQAARAAAIATIDARKTRDDAAYAEAMHRHDAQVAAYEAARAEWERTNPACRHGDPVACPR